MSAARGDIDGQVFADSAHRGPIACVNCLFEFDDQRTVGAEFGQPDGYRRRDRVFRYVDSEPATQALGESIEALHTGDSEVTGRRMVDQTPIARLPPDPAGQRASSAV